MSGMVHEVWAEREENQEGYIYKSKGVHSLVCEARMTLLDFLETRSENEQMLMA